MRKIYSKFALYIPIRYIWRDIINLKLIIMTQTTEQKTRIKHLEEYELRELNRLLTKVSGCGQGFIREVNLAVVARLALMNMDSDHAEAFSQTYEDLYDLMIFLNDLTVSNGERIVLQNTLNPEHHEQQNHA